MNITILGFLLILLHVSGFPNFVDRGSSWYNVKFNGHKVGYYFVEKKTVLKGNRKIPVKSEKMHIILRRMNNELLVDSFLEQRFDENDNLAKFKYRVSEGNINKKIDGTFDYERAKVVLTIEINETRHVQEIDIVKSALSELQVMKKMKKAGLKIGNAMTFTTFLPDSVRFANCRIQIDSIDDISIKGENKRLYKVIREVEDTAAKSINWIDSNFSPWISEHILPKRVFRLERTLKKDALTLNWTSANDFDIFENASIKLKIPGNMTFDLEKVRYKARRVVFRLKNVSPQHMLNGDMQKVVSKDGDGSILLETHTDPSEAGKISALKSFLAPNIYIQSENEKIRKIVTSLIDRYSRLKTALNIKKWVNNNIEWCSDYGFSTALSTLETRRGDCSEFSVLCAAMCRNAKIPARVALGYIIKNSYGGEKRLVPHMWTEILVNNTWYPIDATSERQDVNPFKIRFLSSALKWDEMHKLFNLYANFSHASVELISIVKK